MYIQVGSPINTAVFAVPVATSKPAPPPFPQLEQGKVTVAGEPTASWKIIVDVADPKVPSSNVYVVALAIVLAKRALAKNARLTMFDFTASPPGICH